MHSDQIYSLIPPDAAVMPIGAEGLRTSDTADYAAHPAYANLIANSGRLERIVACTAFARSFCLILLKRLIRYEMIPLDIRNISNIAGLFAFFFAATRNALAFRRRRTYLLQDGAGARVFRSMSTDGIAVVRMPADVFAKLDVEASETFAALMMRRGTQSVGGRRFDESRSCARRSTSGALFAQIEWILVDSGILDAARKYLGRSVRLIDVNPQINDKSDDFWSAIFPDLAIKHPSTAYLHRDASGGDLKAIIYMTDVSSKNGPFSYVLGSSHLPLSRLDDYICEANDSNGMSGTELKNRRKFSALPRRLRQKGSFGNDLHDGSDASRAINQSLWVIQCGRGSIVLFDTKGIHRGGMVQEGERRVITCVIG